MAKPQRKPVSAVARVSRRTFLGTSAALVACREHGSRMTERERLAAAAAPTGHQPAPADVDASASTAHAEPPSPPALYSLFSAYPRLAERVPRLVLGSFPTRLERASELGRSIGSDGIDLWIKRDDTSGELYGGGKVRKLELFLGDAMQKRATTLVTCGGAGSNQAVAVALYGASLGLAVKLYLAPQARGPHVARNLAMSSGAGARLERVTSVTEAMSRAARDAEEDPHVYVIPPGGTAPLGTLAFVSAGLELAADVGKRKLPPPEAVYAALGTGGSAVGLALGAALGGLTTRFVGVRASTPGTSSPAHLRGIHDETIAFARALDPTFPNVAFADTRLAIDGRFLGAGYGIATSAGARAMELFTSKESVSLEPVYTAKTFAALLADAPRRGPVVFYMSHSSRPLSKPGPVPESFADLASRAGG